MKSSRAVIVLAFVALLIGVPGYFQLSNRPSPSNSNNGGSSSPTILTTQKADSAPTLPRLLTNGTRITDENGNIVILRGVNLSGYEYTTPSVLWAHNRRDYEMLASWGFNLVRLPVSWGNIEPQLGRYNDSYLQIRLDQDLAWARQYGIYIVLDMHQICWSSHFMSCNGNYSTGLPAWAVSSYADTELGLRQAETDFWNGLGPNGTPVTQSNPSMQDRFFAMWQHVAKRYASSTVIAGYDLFNEPYDYGAQYVHDPSSLSTYSATILPQFYTKAIDSIRAVDSNHICIWEAPSSIVLARPNIVYSPHYPGLNDLRIYDALKVQSAMQSLATTSQKWNVPVFIGEWGMHSEASGIVQYIEASLAFYDDYSISSAWWNYADSFTMGLFDVSGSPRQILIQNLVRPFLRQTSSLVTVSSTFRVTHLFTQSIRLRGSSHPPVLLIISLPEGYSVKNTQTALGAGTCWQFNSKERTLLLLFPPRVSVVTIQYNT